MPPSRTERRQLGDGSKEVEEAVQRAQRKGLLSSKSNAQIDKRMEKVQPLLEGIVANFNTQRLLTSGEDAMSAIFNPAESVPGESGLEGVISAVGAATGVGGPVSASGAARAPQHAPGPGQVAGSAGTVLGSVAAWSAAIRADWMEAGLGGGSATPGGAQSTQQGCNIWEY
jgi:hypothetical protein